MSLLSDASYLPMSTKDLPEYIPRHRGRLGMRTRSLLIVLTAIMGLFYFFDPSLKDPTLYIQQSLERHRPITYITPDPSAPQLTELWPVVDAYDNTVWQDLNSRTMHALTSCMATNTCRENQTKVVLLGSDHFHMAIVGLNAGEQVWATSIMTSLEELGYSVLYSMTTEVAVQQYRMFPHLVSAVILSPPEIKDCFNGHWCLKTPTNRNGIPFYKLFGFHWWNGADGHPLGLRWIISPENFHNEIFYLGYSIERTCKERTFVQHGKRPKKAFILGKEERYFSESSYGWANDWFADIHTKLGVDFVAGMTIDTTNSSTHIPPPTRNLGTLTKDQFLSEVGHSRVLLGIGQPYLSPSPYDALCLGVPFINPIFSFDKDQPDNRAFWRTQHDSLARIGEPYVYSVPVGDKGAFEKAMEKALSTQIESFIPPEMTHIAVRERMASFLDFDWRDLGIQELANRTEEEKERWLL